MRVRLSILGVLAPCALATALVIPAASAAESAGPALTGVSARAPTTSPQCSDPPPVPSWARALNGAWGSDARVDLAIVIDPPRMWSMQRGAVMPNFVRFGAEGDIAFRGLGFSWHATLGQDTLTITAHTDAGAALGTIRLARLAVPSPAFSLSPLPCAPQFAIAPDRRDAIIAEIDRRFAVMIDSNARTMGGRSGTLSPEMRALATANDPRLAALAGEIGWFDTARFPAATVDHACALAQQSSWPALILAVNAALARDPAFQRAYPYTYARAVDRACFWRCEPQEFGTQMLGGVAGTYDAPLRDAAAVDARRAALGMNPLAPYLASRTGGRAVLPLP